MACTQVLHHQALKSDSCLDHLLIQVSNQGWHIGLQIYWHILKYWLSVLINARTNKLSIIRYWLWPNIDSECFNYRPTGSTKMTRHKSAILKIKRPWPYWLKLTDMPSLYLTQILPDQRSSCTKSPSTHTVLCMKQKLLPTCCTKMTRHKSAILKIKRPWPYWLKLTDMPSLYLTQILPDQRSSCTKSPSTHTVLCMKQKLLSYSVHYIYRFYD